MIMENNINTPIQTKIFIKFCRNSASSICITVLLLSRYTIYLIDTSDISENVSKIFFHLFQQFLLKKFLIIFFFVVFLFLLLFKIRFKVHLYN